MTANAFAYNGLDTRVSKTDSAGTTSYKRAGATVTDSLLKSTVSSTTTDYTPGVSSRVGSDSTFLHSGSTFLHSGLKSADTQTDDGGDISAMHRYDAFGNPVAAWGGWQGPFGYGGPYGYQTDPDHGLMLLGHRYYEADTGRFLTRDPIKDGRNWYGYCGANPTTRVDPDGRNLRLVGFSPAQEEKVRQHLDKLERSPHLKQVVYELINDPTDYIISPPNAPMSPHYNPNTRRLRYDPDELILLPGKGVGGSTITAPPDVVLAHELGHMYGKPDPGGGQSGAPPTAGDTVFDVENPYRLELQLPVRAAY